MNSYKLYLFENKQKKNTPSFVFMGVDKTRLSLPVVYADLTYMFQYLEGSLRCHFQYQDTATYKTTLKSKINIKPQRLKQ